MGVRGRPTKWDATLSIDKLALYAEDAGGKIASESVAPSALSGNGFRMISGMPKDIYS
jgi:hypothetical protein